MSRKLFRQTSRNRLRTLKRLLRKHAQQAMLAAGLTLPALAIAQSVPYPTYVTGPQPNGSWVVSSGQIITPAGTQVNLGIRVRAKAIALNPNVATHTAAVLTMGTSAATEPSRCSTPTPALFCRTTSRSDTIRAAAIAA
jgi:hypothetical protein